MVEALLSKVTVSTPGKVLKKRGMPNAEIPSNLATIDFERPIFLESELDIEKFKKEVEICFKNFFFPPVSVIIDHPENELSDIQGGIIIKMKNAKLNPPE